VLVVRAGKTLTAMAATCTHLACLVEWDAKGRLVRCNCHGGVFTADGKRVSGPPPRDLAPFRATVKGGRVFLES
jgi:Rieske Fe-S protein